MSLDEYMARQRANAAENRLREERWKNAPPCAEHAWGPDISGMRRCRDCGAITRQPATPIEQPNATTGAERSPEEES